MRLGIIAGIHEDVLRLKEGLALLKEKRCDHVVCLGDIVGYSAPYCGYLASRNARTVIQLVRDHCDYIVAGNHDLFHAQRIPDHTTFEYPKNWYAMGLRERKDASRGRLFVYEDELPAEIDADDKAFLYDLPEYFVIEDGDLRILASHYVYPNLVGDRRDFDAIDQGIEQHVHFIEEHNAQIALFSHDLESGIRMFAGDQVRTLSFGMHELPSVPVLLNGPWVAKGTEANGVMVLDTVNSTIEAIPLGTEPHQPSVPGPAHHRRLHSRSR